MAQINHKQLDYDAKNRSLEQEQLIGYWIKSKGIKHSDFVNHPYIDDVILMINMRDEFWNDWNLSEQGRWAGYWNTVFHKRRYLKPKALNRLTEIINKALLRRKITQHRTL
jgi:hypothetical protein